MNEATREGGLAREPSLILLSKSGIIGLELGDFPGQHGGRLFDFDPPATDRFQILHGQFATFVVRIGHVSLLFAGGTIPSMTIDASVINAVHRPRDPSRNPKRPRDKPRIR